MAKRCNRDARHLQLQLITERLERTRVRWNGEGNVACRDMPWSSQAEDLQPDEARSDREQDLVYSIILSNERD